MVEIGAKFVEHTSHSETSSNSSGVRFEAGNALDPMRALLHHLIDYAGLFPPASLPMAASIANYASYKSSQWSWIIGRFILPVSRLDEFSSALAQFALGANGNGLADWPISALLGNDASGDLAKIRAFNEAMANSNSGLNAQIDSVELKVDGPQQIDQTSALIPEALKAYFEFPLSKTDECLSAIAAQKRRAKIRTGGEAADRFPSSVAVAEFIRACCADAVPFKATAGLHHAVRSTHRLSYAPDSPSGLMHGFLNVFVAAIFMRSGMGVGRAVEILDEQSIGAFRIDPGGLRWRDEKIPLTEISSAREKLTISFGSCSFTEPIEDLKSAHLL